MTLDEREAKDILLTDDQIQAAVQAVMDKTSGWTQPGAYFKERDRAIAKAQLRQIVKWRDWRRPLCHRDELEIWQAIKEAV